MIIGLLKEIKNHEYRVGLIPSSVSELVQQGHRVLVQTQAGNAIGFSDDTYKQAGAEIVQTTKEIFSNAEMIVKVKEPQPEECEHLRREQIIFSFLHLAPDPKQALLLLESGCVAIACETITDDQGGLPLLRPMSEIAGRLSIQAGAHYLEKTQGGSGVLLGRVNGVMPGKVVVLGGGAAGTQAVEVAVGMGARVVLIEKSSKRLQVLEDIFGAAVSFALASEEAIEQHVTTADLVVGAVLVPGGVAPKVVTRAMLKKMRPGSVVVDVSIDQGGCFESSKPTTHSDPVYREDGVLHYCVTNMPGAVPYTASFALNNATLPFILALANKGYRKACLENPQLMNGLNICEGKVTHPLVAEGLHLPYTPPQEILN